VFRHNFKKRVRYGETDKMGYLYYGNYPMLYEIGRVEAIRHLGLSYKQFEDDLGIIMPVVEVKSRYIQPVYYDELITIETRLEELPNKMIHFHHTIYNEDNKAIHKGEVKLFFVNVGENKRTDIPAELIQKLLPYFE
jgi:acyl-CoA thioester hydrolase